MPASGELVTATLECEIASEEASFKDAGASSHGIESSRDDVFVEEPMGETSLKHFLPSELVYDSENSHNALP